MLCHRCRAHDREAARRALCPECGESLRLQPDTGRCRRCSRTCIDCGHVLRFKTSVRCRDCARRHDAASRKRLCPRCGLQGFIRDTTGWCGSCSRPGGVPKPPRPCKECGRLARRISNGLCSRCWQRHPERARKQADRLAAQLPDPPWWLSDFADQAADRHCMGRACTMITMVGRLLTDGQSTSPQALLERSRRPGRSQGALARTLEDFFVEHQLAFGLDQTARLAAARRKRRVDETPEPFRPVVQRFCDYLVHAQERARRAGTRERADSTIEGTIAIARDLARFLETERSKNTWTTVQPADVEAFLNTRPAFRRRRLTALRQFFSWARRNKIILIDPTSAIMLSPHRGFKGVTLTIGEQRAIYRRWTTSRPDVHPHEAAIGLLSLLHAFTGAELRSVRVEDIDLGAATLRVNGRPHSVPLDPASSQAIQNCLTHRAGLGTRNPHLIVTKLTKTTMSSASPAYLTHVLDPAATTTKKLRSTRLVDLINRLDPKVVAVALGMSAEGLLDYLGDHVDAGRLPDRPATPNP